MPLRDRSAQGSAIGKLRSGSRYQLSGGIGCDLVEGHPCQGQGALIAIEMGQNDRGSRIFIAEPVALDDAVDDVADTEAASVAEELSATDGAAS